MTPLLLKVLALCGIFACAFLLVQGAMQSVLGSRRVRGEVNRRLQLLRGGHSREQVVQIMREGSSVAHSTGWFGSILNAFYQKHAKAAVKVGANQVLLLMIAAVGVLFLLALITATSSGTEITAGTILLLLTFSIALGAGVPWMALTRRASKRTRLMEEQFPIALDIFTRALRAGHPVASAIELLTSEMPDPIGSEFGMVFDEVSYGSDLNTSLRNLGDRWDLPDLKMFAVCLSVQTETGGNLSEILSNLSQVIRERASMYLKVRSLSAEGRMSAWMLSILPIVTFLLLFVGNPAFYLDVAEDPIFTYGFVTLLVLYTLGVIWLRRLVDIKV